MNKVNLPDGGWAVLRDPETVTERQRRPLVRLQRRTIMKSASALAGLDLDKMTPADALTKLAPTLSDEDFDALEDIDDMVIVTLVDSWSYEQPVTVDGSLDLPSKARSALLEECRPLMSRLLGDTTDEDVLDPDSPTEPANGSDRP